VEDVQGTPWCVSHLLWACSKLDQDPKDEQQTRDDDIATLMDLHFKKYLHLQANNDMYMWNQVNCAKNHYGKVGASSPYKQWSYPKVSCPPHPPLLDSKRPRFELSWRTCCG